MSKSQRKIFDDHASNYGAEIDHAVSFIHAGSDFFVEAKAWLLQDLVRKYISSKSQVRLLDVGCGTGSLHARLKEHGFSVHGTDVSFEAARIAQSRNLDTGYTITDGSRLPYKNQVFDMTISVCAMHHISREQHLPLIYEMQRVTRVGGLIAIIDHNPFNPLTRLAVHRCAFDKYAELLSAAHARHLFHSLGMLPRTMYFLFFPFGRSVLFSIERHLGWLPLGAQYCVYAMCE